MNKLKTYFFAGLLVWLPIGLTIWFIKFIVTSLDAFIPAKLSTQNLIGINIPGGSIIIAALILLATGLIATNILGQKLLNLGDKIISSIPLVKSIYKGIKQVSDTLLSSQSNAFRKAVLVKFPHTNSLTIAFITGNPTKEIIANSEHEKYINVYVPTTPNPTSGYFIMVPKEDTHDLNLSVEQALRYVISMGTIKIPDLIKKPSKVSGVVADDTN